MSGATTIERRPVYDTTSSVMGACANALSAG